MDLHGDLSFDLEPQARARSNTWPLPRPENFVDMIKEEGDEGQCAAMAPGLCLLPDGQAGPPPGGLGAAGLLPAKKNSTRRNAWGNQSYADLITQAITTAPDKRLTLSQIYEWMVHNVHYFKDKGDSNSSAGWKNSIRHNLSLHNRFMRVQNEGTGKSSWWMINPDAKPGKSARRRATSMETSKFEKRRGRVKKKVEAMRNCLGATDASPSPCSSVSEGLDMFPESPLHSGSFQLSPQDFRPRASSSASSCGRLSPIPAVEPDCWSSSPYAAYADQLAGSLEQNMKLDQMYTGFPGQTQGQQHQQADQPAGPPPPYQPAFDVQYASPGAGGGAAAAAATAAAAAAANPSGLAFATTCPVHRVQGCSCMLRCPPESVTPSGLSPSYRSEPSPPQPQQPPPPYPPPSPDDLEALPGSLPPGLSPGPADVPGSLSGSLSGSPGALGGALAGLVDSLDGMADAPTTMMGQLMAGALNTSTLLDDLNFKIEGEFDCNVEEVIERELSLEGSLDFNFGQHSAHSQHLQPLQQSVSGQQGAMAPQHGGAMGGGMGATMSSPQAPYTTVTSGHSWVH